MLEDAGSKNQQGLKCGPVKGFEATELNLRDGFDEILIDGDEIGAVLVVDDDIGQTDEHTRFRMGGIRKSPTYTQLTVRTRMRTFLPSGTGPSSV